MSDPTAVAMAAQILKEKEGFRTKPYWDVNAYRVGYGSDTVTLADGTVRRVTPGMVITKADAERDLARRMPQFMQGIRSTVGPAFDRLPPNAQAALTSVGYNYGSISKVKGLVGAAKSGDLQGIANAIIGAAGHNKGVNKDRRYYEAGVVLGKTIPKGSSMAAINTATGLDYQQPKVANIDVPDPTKYIQPSMQQPKAEQYTIAGLDLQPTNQQPKAEQYTIAGLDLQPTNQQPQQFRPTAAVQNSLVRDIMPQYNTGYDEIDLSKLPITAAVRKLYG